MLILFSGEEELGIELRLPALSLELAYMADVFDIVLPSLEVVAAGGISMASDIEGTLPALTLTAATTRSITSRYEIDISLPTLESSTFGSSGIEIDIPRLSLSAEGRTAKIADIKAKLPGLTMSAISGITSTIELPFLSMSMEAYLVNASVELTGNMVASLPSLRMRSNTKVDDVINISIPNLTMEIDADVTVTATGVLIGPVVEDDALRYVRGAVR